MAQDHGDERSFTRQVIDLARLMGWRVAHFRAALSARGWRTPVQGDGVGFPDLIMVRYQRLIVAELKVGRRRPTPEQHAWIEAFRSAGVAAYIWRPCDWDDIVRILK